MSGVELEHEGTPSQNVAVGSWLFFDFGMLLAGELTELLLGPFNWISTRCLGSVLQERIRTARAARRFQRRFVKRWA
jgi:hypothetical protein